jgi:3-hydroxyisobutyrate dehydrogenase-like beta-hydroxyacid dehydrogenase
VWELLDDKGLLDALPPGGTVVNHGTGDPAVAIELAHHGEANGRPILDAPVSGGRPGAERKALTTFVGGDAEAAERCRPVFEAFSTTVAYMGPAGAGQMTKLMNNASLLANLRNAEDIISIGAGRPRSAQARRRAADRERVELRAPVPRGRDLARDGASPA